MSSQRNDEQKDNFSKTCQILESGMMSKLIYASYRSLHSVFRIIAITIHRIKVVVAIIIIYSYVCKHFCFSIFINI